jgi:uncharacterized protein involved in outer membrane biogenesis
MKSYLLFLAIICCITTVNAQDKQPYLVKSLSGENINSAQLTASGGSIHVTGVNASEARLEVYVTANNNQHLSKEELKQRLDEYYTLDISVSNNKLIASVKQKSFININWKKSVNVSFKAYLPVNVTTDIETSGGSISLSNLNGEQNFKTSGGSISVSNVKGKMKGKGSGGSIHIINASNDIDLRTSGGSIDAKECTGNITLKTSGGSIILNDMDGTINAQTSGGSIHADNVKGDLVTGTSGGSIKLSNMYCSVEAQTSGGGIEAFLKDAAKPVKLKNSGGSISLQLPANKGYNLDLAGNKINMEMKNFSGSVDDKSVEGKINGGGTSIEARSRGGKINVTFD